MWCSSTGCLCITSYCNYNNASECCWSVYWIFLPVFIVFCRFSALYVPGFRRCKFSVKTFFNFVIFWIWFWMFFFLFFFSCGLPLLPFQLFLPFPYGVPRWFLFLASGALRSLTRMPIAPKQPPPPPPPHLHTTRLMYKLTSGESVLRHALWCHGIPKYMSTCL